MHKEIETLEDAAVKTYGVIETLKAGALADVVRELRHNRRDFGAAVQRVGFNDEVAQWLWSKVEPGRGRER